MLPLSHRAQIVSLGMDQPLGAQSGPSLSGIISYNHPKRSQSSTGVSQWPHHSCECQSLIPPLAQTSQGLIKSRPTIQIWELVVTAGKAFGKSCWLGKTGSKSLPKPKLDLLPVTLQSLCTNGLREDGKVCTGIHKSLVEKILAAPGEATYLATAAVILHLHFGCFICM